MVETLIFGPISVKFRSIILFNSLWKPCKLLNNSTFYYLKSLIALPIQMIRPANPYNSYFGGCHPPIPPSSFAPEYTGCSIFGYTMMKGFSVFPFLSSSWLETKNVNMLLLILEPKHLTFANIFIYRT